MGKPKDPTGFSRKHYQELSDFLLSPVSKHRDPRAASSNLRIYPEARRTGRDASTGLSALDK